MANAELLKLIAGLECCSTEKSCKLCPYKDKWVKGNCIEALLAESLEFLREIENDGLY